jgi:cytidylate kinase
VKQLVIAIDGPAASGKSTTARLTAKRLGYLFVDTGAMYRAVTLKVLEHGADPSDEPAVSRLARETSIRLVQQGGDLRVILDGRDVSREIRAPEVTRAVSAVSAMKPVRELMVREQRSIGANGGVILEGRDIGTVVFPDADLKIYMVADVQRRAQRRQKDLEQQGRPVVLDELVNEIVQRDKKDAERSISPMRPADDAVVLDTSGLKIEEQVEFIVERANELLQQRA